MKQLPDTSTVVHSFCVWHSFDLGGTKHSGDMSREI